MALLEDLDVYRLALELADEVFAVVEPWEDFHRRTIGMQLTRAADSVAANISEGYGRFHYKDNMTFCYFARGSLMEAKTHLDLARRRGLIGRDRFDSIIGRVNFLHLKLNAYIKSIRQTSDSWQESQKRQ